MSKLTIPKLSDPFLQRLLRLVNASHEPIMVNVLPEPGAVINDCFNIVQKKILSSGGKRICGWQVLKTKFVIEAEAHAVWETPNGELLDITPKLVPSPQTIFVEDEGLIYEGKQINNYRLNITKNSLVDDLIKVCEHIFEFENRGERANHSDLTPLLNDEQKRYWIGLQQWRNNLILFLDNGSTENSLCYCNRGLPFIDCHRPELLKWLSVMD